MSIESPFDAYEQVYKDYNNPIIRHDKGLAYSRDEYIEIEPDRTVRTSFTKRDYHSFRSEESVPIRQKYGIKMSLQAYEHIGLIKNIIDLMSDFGSQGISIMHTNPSIERFYKKWFKIVDGPERSERFFNYLYKAGNVVIKRSTAKVSKGIEKNLKKLTAADMDIDMEKYVKREIPWHYDFLNPLAVDVVDYHRAVFYGKPEYILNLTESSFNSIKNDGKIILPETFKNSPQNGMFIPLDNNKIEIFHYKKDDWNLWANPMIYSILDDLVMLEKMKLADLAALDGAISQVRLWRLGSLEHKIIPPASVLNKLRNILASNVGGGTLDLVWGPELDFKESQSQVYRFLGSQKYEPVLTSIYQGLGVPPTLTGNSSSGGMTNNHISLKTLIERLNYGRRLLIKFWEKEIEIVQKAMGFRTPAVIRLDPIILSDDAAYKQQLMNAADRNYISEETIVERLGEIPEVEAARVRREEKLRRTNYDIPRKATTFHNPNIESEITKALVTTDRLKDEFYDELGIPKQNPPAESLPGGPIGTKQNKKVVEKKSPEQGGRPLNSKDKNKRKPKRVIPRTGKTTAVLWAYNAQKTISDAITPMILDFYGKKNLRSLSKDEFSNYEKSKLCILRQIKPFEDLTQEKIFKTFSSELTLSDDFIKYVRIYKDKFVCMNNRDPNIEELRYLYATAYITEAAKNDNLPI